MDDYSDIINLPRPVSKRQPMSIHDRAAQFAPFAALNGYDAAIGETARLTDSKPEPDDDTVEKLNKAVNLLIERAPERPEVHIEYFLKDARKEGGAILSFTGRVRRIDLVNGVMIFATGERIALENIVDIEFSG